MEMTSMLRKRLNNYIEKQILVSVHFHFECLNEPVVGLYQVVDFDNNSVKFISNEESHYTFAIQDIDSIKSSIYS